MSSQTAEQKIISSFGAVASTLGYSEIHGKIIGVLLVEDKSLSLQELADRTRYSLSTISISIDFLDVLGVIKKMKREGDRKIYVELTANLFDCLRKAVIMKAERTISSALNDFEQEKRKTKDKKLLKTITILEKEIKRLQTFTNLISSLEPNNKH